MKKLLLLTFLSVCFVGCTSKFSIFDSHTKAEAELNDDKSTVAGGSRINHVPHGLREMSLEKKASKHKSIKKKKYS